jgi:RHH-type proline utilization regulon transcriptional repressor/proline dehydrogenase/delta 1-pyrroline-5-carboxylate dehydrogenase
MPGDAIGMDVAPSALTDSAFDKVLEQEVRAIGARLFAAARRRLPRIYRGVQGLLLRQAIQDTRLRDALFQFVDVMPQLEADEDIARHFGAYLAQAGIAGWRGALFGLGARPGFAWAVRLGVVQFARLLLAEEAPAALGRAIRSLARVPAQVTVDTVGEAVLTEAEADNYLARNLALIRWLEQIGRETGQAPHLSIKLTALTPHFDPLDPDGTRRRVFRRLEPLMGEVARTGATLTIDMEHYELKPLILRLFLAMLEAWPQAGKNQQWLPAIALQTYLPDTANDLETLLDAAQRHGRRLGVRLVKGAYWDQELAWSTQRNWPLPVFRDKAQTDAHYEGLTRHLLAHADVLYPAIASHNLRSQSVALAWAGRLGLDADQWEAQVLYGMAEPLRDALAAAGACVRVYLPCGDLIIGIAYLIRRLLENTASTSVLRLAYVEEAALETLLAPPQATTPQPDSTAYADGFRNAPLTDFSRTGEQKAFREALAAWRHILPERHTLAIGGCTAAAEQTYTARDPADPGHELGSVELASLVHANQAVRNATDAFPAWRGRPAAQRTRILRAAAEAMDAQRHRLAALQVLEVGKNWREADADVAEAIDFLRYYAAEAERLAGWHETMSFPGETNVMAYEPRGVAVVIAPWNFPLAILTGMTSAALVTGNCAIMKPALPALLIAHELRRLLLEAGVPPEVCQLLPGDAPIGAHLVSHPGIHVIAFTGSRAVGLQILQAAHTPAPGQCHVKQVVCEMGGKNALVVDRDADLDETVLHVLHSAFGFQGQKCSAASRLIAVGDIHERLLERLIAAVDAQPWGPPEDPRHVFGPLITEVAQRKALDYIAIGRQEGRLAYQGRVPEQGWYVPPTIFTDIRPEHRLAREEIFGPVLAVLRARSFDEALAMAQDCDYALTGGVCSRLPDHLASARDRYRVGNLYLNRKITGARVGAQPFGGVALSGTGIQAGGPDYLKQFMWSRVVSTNTFRHGYIPSQ